MWRHLRAAFAAAMVTLVLGSGCRSTDDGPRPFVFSGYPVKKESPSAMPAEAEKKTAPPAPVPRAPAVPKR
jgi:hypothetical protein